MAMSLSREPGGIAGVHPPRRWASNSARIDSASAGSNAHDGCAARSTASRRPPARSADPSAPTHRNSRASRERVTQSTIAVVASSEPLDARWSFPERWSGKELVPPPQASSDLPAHTRFGRARNGGSRLSPSGAGDPGRATPGSWRRRDRATRSQDPARSMGDGQAPLLGLVRRCCWQDRRCELPRRSPPGAWLTRRRQRYRATPTRITQDTEATVPLRTSTRDLQPREHSDPFGESATSDPWPEPRQQNEQALMARSVAGDAAAFADLLAPHRRLLDAACATAVSDRRTVRTRSSWQWWRRGAAPTRVGRTRPVGTARDGALPVRGDVPGPGDYRRAQPPAHRALGCSRDARRDLTPRRPSDTVMCTRPRSGRHRSPRLGRRFDEDLPGITGRGRRLRR